METVNITINNIPLEVPKSTTILQAARMINIEIPTLCHMKLEDFCIENKPAGCRICMVDVKGRRNL
ncbi:MAG: 2Fe-2S iron-sulfur cluster binding domain-containing protein, partial [Bacteroidales bacterium]|nr:2Fe-2S iron-sulfur cluster binding domain-containing protein [Bacteroidales bacterium]